MFMITSLTLGKFRYAHNKPIELIKSRKNPFEIKNYPIVKIGQNQEVKLFGPSKPSFLLMSVDHFQVNASYRFSFAAYDHDCVSIRSSVDEHTISPDNTTLEIYDIPKFDDFSHIETSWIDQFSEEDQITLSVNGADSKRYFVLTVVAKRTCRHTLGYARFKIPVTAVLRILKADTNFAHSATSGILNAMALSFVIWLPLVKYIYSHYSPLVHYPKQKAN